MKRLRLIAMVVAFLLLGLLAFRPTDPKEPEYKGRKLSEWLNDNQHNASHTNSIQDSEAVWKTTEHAVKEIGTNAIPTLLLWIQSTNAPLRDRMNSLLDKQSVIRFRFQDSMDKPMMAEYAFKMLGNDALPAVPALVQLARSSNATQRFNARLCLDIIDDKRKVLLPVYLQLLHDSDRHLQLSTALYLSENYPEEAEKAGVNKMFPEVARLRARATNINTPITR